MKGDEVAMRTRSAFLSYAVAAAGLLLVATTAHAWNTKCTANNFTFTVIAGPCPIADPSNPVCGGSGGYTGIQYQMSGTGTPDAIATLVTANNTVLSPPATQVFAPCVGDSATGLGKYSCHEEAVRVSPDANKAFWVIVSGSKLPIETSIAVKKGYNVKSAAIVGLGLDAPDACVSSCGGFHPDQTLKKTETLVFKGCAVTFVLDLTSGEVISAANDPTQSTSQNCSPLIVDDVSSLEVFYHGQSLGLGDFGDGMLATGSTSCTTRVIGGRLYTWGSPCP